MWIILILLMLLAIWHLVSSSKQKKSGQAESPKKQEPDIQKISQTALAESTVKDPSIKTAEMAKKAKTLVASDVTNRNSNIQKQEQNSQPEQEIIENALVFYKSHVLENNENVEIEDIIQLTNSEKLLWTEGYNDEKSIEVWATYFQKGLLALYRDLLRKKYQLIYYNDNKGFIQPYAKLVLLRQAIATQIENRKKHVESVPTTGFLVRTNTFKCTKNHGVEDIIAVFTVLSRSGNIVIVEAPAGHCARCGVFYIHEYTYQRILSFGQPLCTVISEKQYISGSYKRMNAGMAQQSLLRMCGYTVSATEGLSDSERRRILDTIISNGIMSKFDVIEYLNYFINMRKNDTKDMSEAIRKWNSDLRYVEGINVYSLKRFKVDRIYRIEK